jgi:hypothetical protein
VASQIAPAEVFDGKAVRVLVLLQAALVAEDPERSGRWDTSVRKWSSVSSLCVLSIKLCFLGSELTLGVLDRLGPAREGRVSVGLSLQWTDDIAGLALPA